MSSLTLHECRTAGEQKQASDFIRAQFRFHFDAEVNVQAERLFVAWRDGQLVLAFGLRTQCSGWFSGIYAPAELALQVAGHGVQAIVELVHLSVRDVRVLSQALPEIALLLEQQGFERLLFTGTRCVCRLLNARGWRARVLAAATADALPASERRRWGSYYDAEPQVMVGSIDEAAALARREFLQEACA